MNSDLRRWGLLLLLVAGLAGLYLHAAGEDAPPALPLALPRAVTPPAMPVTPPDAATLAAEARLPYTSRLLRTVLLGRPYGLGVEELRRDRLQRDAGNLQVQLFAAAVTALNLPADGLDLSDIYLRDFLASASAPEPLREQPEEFAPLGNDDLAMLHLYALVQAGRAAQAIAILQQYSGSSQQFTRAFALAALRAVGTPQAREALKSAYAGDAGFAEMAGEALAVVEPNFSALRDHAGLVTPQRRYSPAMMAQAQAPDINCSAVLPIYLLGFLDNQRPAAPAEVELLRRQGDAPDNAHWLRYYYAYAALALRSHEPFAWWIDLYRREFDETRRGLLLRILSMQYPDELYAAAPELLRQAPSGGWSSLELLIFYDNYSKGRSSYSPFDLVAVPPPRYRQRFPARSDGARHPATPLVELWARGEWPADPNCPVCGMSWVRDMIGPREQPQLLLGLLRAPARDPALYSELYQLDDARLLPVLRYLRASERGAEGRDTLDAVLLALRQQVKARPCAGPSEECLRREVLSAPSLALQSDGAAIDYLTGLADDSLRLRFLDETRRRAEVLRNGRREVWEYWLGAWRPAAE